MKLNFSITTCLLLSAFCFFGCKPKRNYIVKVKAHKITPNTMYNADMVSDYLFDVEEMQMDSLKTKSEKVFLKGLDLYKNKKNPTDAIDYFEQSVLLYPDAKTYYELGNAILDAQISKDYVNKILLKQADSAFEVAKALNFKPLSQVYYSKACAANMIHEVDTVAEGAYGWMAWACQNGFNDTNLMKHDTRISSFTKTAGYRELVQNWLSKRTNQPGLTLYQQYKNSYPVISQPFEIKMEKVGMEEYKQSISYDYAKFIPEMENTEFGRGVSNDYVYVGRIVDKPLYTAMIYFSVDYYGMEMQPIMTKLVTYDTAGNVIGSKLFSCQCSPEKIKTGKIENNVITLQDYNRVWKYPIDSVPFESNVVLKYEPLGKATFVLSDSGKIIKQTMTAGYSDSAKVVSTH